MWAKITESHDLDYFNKSWIRYNGMTYSNPKADVLKAAGYYEVPEIEDGKVATRWDVVDGELVPTLEDAQEEQETQGGVKLSKLKLVVELKQRGLYDTFAAMIENVGLQVEWQCCQELNTSHPLYQTYSAAIMTALGIDQTTFDQIVENSISEED